jgi:hypothetical protein
MSEGQGSNTLGVALVGALVLGVAALLAWGAAVLVMVLRSDVVAMPGWGWTALTFGLAAVALCGSGVGAAAVVETVKKKPGGAGVAVLTLLTTVVMEIAKDAYQPEEGHELQTAFITGGAAGVVFLAGILCQAQDRAWRILGAVLGALPAALLLVLLVRRETSGLLDQLAESGPQALFALACLILVAVALVVLTRRRVVDP